MGKSKDAKVAVNEYYMSMHLGVCTEADAVLEIVVGEKIAWSGEVTKEQTINVRRPSLFGGVKKEGGVVGYVHALMGGPLQVVPDWLAARFGLTSANCPGFRGMTSLFFVGSYSTTTWVPVPGSGSGGGGGTGDGTWIPPGGGKCPAPWTLITLANAAADGPGDTVPASDLRPGMFVWTKHEHTMLWGAFEVEAVTIEPDQERWDFVTADGRRLTATPNHRLYVGGGQWRQIKQFEPDENVWGDVRRTLRAVGYRDRGDVVRISVKDARTYLAEGILSHNLKPVEDGDF